MALRLLKVDNNKVVDNSDNKVNEMFKIFLSPKSWKTQNPKFRCILKLQENLFF